MRVSGREVQNCILIKMKFFLCPSDWQMNNNINIVHTMNHINTTTNLNTKTKEKQHFYYINFSHFL